MRLTCLVDNVCLPPGPPRGLVTRILDQRRLLSQHGFSMLIESNDRRLLLDTGASVKVIEHNMGVLGLAPADIDLIFLSHGHRDHTGGLIPFLEAGVPVHCSEEVLLGEKFVQSNGGMVGVSSSPEVLDLLKRAGPHLSEEPTEILPGVHASGYIPRVTDFEGPKGFWKREGGELVSDDIPDDQSLIIETAKGLVVVCGCSHSGVVNIARRARELFDRDIYLMIGGFHLGGASMERLLKVAAALRNEGVDHVAPMHCSGFGAKKVFSDFFGNFEHCGTGCIISVE